MAHLTENERLIRIEISKNAFYFKFLGQYLAFVFISLFFFHHVEIHSYRELFRFFLSFSIPGVFYAILYLIIFVSFGIYLWRFWNRRVFVFDRSAGKLFVHDREYCLLNNIDYLVLESSGDVDSPTKYELFLIEKDGMPLQLLSGGETGDIAIAAKQLAEFLQIELFDKRFGLSGNILGWKFRL